MKKLLMLLLFMIIGCGLEPDVPPHIDDSGSLLGEGQRFKITLKGKFKDNLAYGNVRGIYIIEDKLTRKSWFGVSGIGISEINYTTDGDGNRTEYEQ